MEFNSGFKGLNYEWILYMEHPSSCINHKDLEYLQSQPTHFYEYVY